MWPEDILVLPERLADGSNESCAWSLGVAVGQMGGQLGWEQREVEELDEFLEQKARAGWPNMAVAVDAICVRQHDKHRRLHDAQFADEALQMPCYTLLIVQAYLLAPAPRCSRRAVLRSPRRFKCCFIFRFGIRIAVGAFR